jgi:hypothetical protein
VFRQVIGHATALHEAEWQKSIISGPLAFLQGLVMLEYTRHSVRLRAKMQRGLGCRWSVLSESRLVFNGSPDMSRLDFTFLDFVWRLFSREKHH